MSVWDWIRYSLLSRRPPPLEAIEAREVARRVGEHADRLNETLEKYRRADDPFAAFMADLYNRDQLTRMHRGSDR